MDIKVIGYYNHFNFGDDQYIETFKCILDKIFIDYKSIEFIDCDKSSNFSYKDNDVILLGGGDILNHYFLDKIISLFHNKPNKIIAVSVGIPYSDIIFSKKLNIIDYIFLRTKQNLSLLEQFYDKNKIFYLPDISFFSEKPFRIQASSSSIKRIGICLSRHIYVNNPYYNNILHSFAKFISYVSIFNFEIVLVPFNTNSKNSKENDILIQNDLIKILDGKCNNIVIIDKTLSTVEMNALFQSFYICIPMRFHACLFSIHNNIPFLPVFTTQKIQNVLLDISWQHGYKLDCNEQDIPIKLDFNILLRRFTIITSLHSYLINKLNNQKFDFTSLDTLKDKIEIYEERVIKTLDININEKIQETLLKLYEYLEKKEFYKDFRLTHREYQYTVVNLVSYYLTGKINSIYNYGLQQKMFNIDYNYLGEWKWILKDYKPKEAVIFTNNTGLFNLNLHDQNDYSGVHRSGWQYVYTTLQPYHNENSDLYLDLYIDKTFHWNNDINKELGIIPYRKKWIGFVHHTFDTEFSDFNNVELLKNPDFIESLAYCKGIIVLSIYLRNEFIRRLNLIGITNVPVYTLVHPTETQVPQFDYDKFLTNTDKKIIHIGGWLRNIYSYYLTRFPTNITLRLCALASRSFSIRKTILKGNHMNNYVPYDNFLEKFEHFLLNPDSCFCKDIGEIPCASTSPCISRDKCNMNNWYKHFFNHTKQIIESVDVLSTVDNEMFDDLLTQNVVFINLCDASAVNTLIECIVRNTPIIINRHPAVIELLGNSYPLYYNSDNYTQMNIDILNLFSNKDRIYNAHVYLKKLNKNIFTIEYFIQSFLSILNSL